MTPAELAVVGGAAGVGAVVVMWAGQRWLGPVRPATSVVVIDPPTWLLPSGGAPTDGGRALRVVGPGRPYDWARDGEAVGA